MNDDAYYLAINGLQTGPFSTEQVREMWRAGTVSAQTLYWRQGESAWQPLGGMFAAAQGVPPPLNPVPPVATVPAGYQPTGSAPVFYAVPTTSGLAITSFVLSLVGFLLSFLTWIPAIIFGHIALSQIRRSGGRLTGRGFAVAGLVISYGFTLIAVVVFTFLIGVVTLDATGKFASFKTQVHPVATPDPEFAAGEDLSRARQISMAIDRYVEDHDGVTPPDFAALFPKYLQDRAVLGEGEPGGKGTGFDYLAPNQKFAELDPDEAFMYGKTESANHKKVIIYGDDRAGFDWDDSHQPRSGSVPTPK